MCSYKQGLFTGILISNNNTYTFIYILKKLHYTVIQLSKMLTQNWKNIKTFAFPFGIDELKNKYTPEAK